jgi:TolA-binding protein
MKIIKTKVIGDTITPIEQGYVIENQVNQYAIEFDFDETWNFEEKYCIFQDEFEEQTFKRAIINNQVIVPSELLNGRITIQVYGQNVEDDVITQRQPSLKYVFSILNSLPTNASEEEDTPTPSQWEIYISQIEEMCNDLQDQFDDLKEECETKCDDVIERLEQDEQNIQTNTDNIRTNAENIDKLNNDLLDYSLITETGNKISMSINSQTYVITLSLKDKNDNILSTQSVDLPLETMIVSASYSNGILTFTLKNGQTLQVPISDLIDGLVSTDTFNEAVQGLSNRITTIENDYLKASDKTELQNQITQNADDISDIKGEQLTQNADIESLQQENERLSRIVSGLPTKNASGTNIVLNDMVNCEIKEISLKGDTLQDGTPTPDSPVDIQSVSGNQAIQCCGKNLFNPSLYEDNKYQNYSPNNTSIANNNSFWITGYQLIKPNTTYTKSSLVSGGVIYDINKNAIRTLAGDIYTFETPDNAYYVCFTIPKTSLSFNGNIQLELGDTATDYEQYSGTTFPISLGNIELNKIGDYQDKIYKQNDKWYLEKNVGKVVLDGTQNIEQINTEKTNTTRIMYRNLIVGRNADNQVICNYLTSVLNWNEDVEGIFINGSDLVIRINKSVIGETTNSINEWLSTHNVIACYRLNNPVITEITDTTLINQLEALNNYILLTNNTIISNGNLPVINDITGYVDIMSLISTQNNRNVLEEKKIVTKPVEEPIEEPIEEPVETKEEER